MEKMMEQSLYVPKDRDSSRSFAKIKEHVLENLRSCY
jgi:hypothetical protein